MSNVLLRKQLHEEIKRDEIASLDYRIKEQVIQALGRPSDLRTVQIRKVWKDHYRVNVYVGLSAASVRIANSYLLKVDGDGSLIAATPPITKQY